MLKLEVIGNLGADAQVKSENGRTFVTFNVSHSERYKDANGQPYDVTTWVSCAMSGNGGNVLQYLKRGQRVFCTGNMSVRIFDSAKDHCKKVGINLSVNSLELIGTPERIPTRLYDEDGVEIEVRKAHYVVQAEQFGKVLRDFRGNQFKVDTGGFVNEVTNG